MKPIGPLMWEHRLIERMIRAVKVEIERIARENTVNPVAVDVAVDFIRTYADRTHHGKEEDILFREMKKKKLTPEHARIMDELIEEHREGRKTVARLVAAKEQYLKGDAAAVATVVECLRWLTDFYPKHITKEDKGFFYPILAYFSDAEQKAMLDEFYEFDRKMIHETYSRVVDAFDTGRP
ncbi:MAG TPA: hemerythrin domain-containing protein [Syntrophales bacterium]|nr:hemerythrin domain-containing protein [Syntrophales bacterium]